MPSSVPVFPLGTVEQVAKVLGDLYTGSELTRLCAEIPLVDDPGEGYTKWRRLAQAVSVRQSRQGDGRPLIALLSVAMNPHRTLDRAARAAIVRDELNQVLSLSGLKVREDGRVSKALASTTAAQAISRTERLHKVLDQRSAHPQVLAYCRPELLRDDYYEAVFEATKGLGSRLRHMGGQDADGPRLVESVLEGREPVIRLNEGATQTQRDEQRGVALLLKGCSRPSATRRRTSRAWSGP